jgi:hypothetical protein
LPAAVITIVSPGRIVGSVDPVKDATIAHAAPLLPKRVSMPGESKLTAQKKSAQGAKSGQWTQLNQKTGAMLNQSGGSVFPTAAEAAGPAHVSAVTLQAVAASQHTVAADLGPMKMQRPENWLLKLPEQQGQFVTIAPKAGITDDGVGYGVLLNGLPAKQVRGMNIDDATSGLVQFMQKNNGLQQVSKAAPIMVGGLEGPQRRLAIAFAIPGREGSTSARTRLADHRPAARRRPYLYDFRGAGGRFCSLAASV